MVRIILGSEWLELTPEGQWLPSTPGLASLARLATRLSAEPFYSYSPSHGAYGVLLAHQIAGRFGGKVQVDAAEQAQEQPHDVVF